MLLVALLAIISTAVAKVITGYIEGHIIITVNALFKACTTLHSPQVCPVWPVDAFPLILTTNHWTPSVTHGHIISAVWALIGLRGNTRISFGYTFLCTSRYSEYVQRQDQRQEGYHKLFHFLHCLLIAHIKNI